MTVTMALHSMLNFCNNQYFISQTKFLAKFLFVRIYATAVA